MRNTTFQPGDKVLSDLDGQVYEVMDYGPRDVMESLSGVKLLGNAIAVQGFNGVTKLLYDWEVTKIEKTDGE